MNLLDCNRAGRTKTLAMWLRLICKPGLTAFPLALLYGALVVAVGCHRSHEPSKPSIFFTHIPPAGGGPEFVERIGGRVENAAPGARIVVYALGRGAWWVQPFRSHPLTEIAGDGGWDNATHLGTDYAALLVAPGYQPMAKLSALPSTGESVLAVATTKASSEPPPSPKIRASQNQPCLINHCNIITLALLSSDTERLTATKH